ncbi:MAG TPA: type VI secretion system tip protein TssI/VgrG [Geminicoccaceae bacterium]|nr:type VI secretion system tip protein TssI/VgrG [Geminicoccaceae bacterium]
MAATREVIVDTKIAEAFTFRHMRGREAVSELFDYHVELLSESDTVKLEDLLGTPLLLSMELSGATRHFHGHVVHFAYAGTDGSYACYHARVRPWLWFLSTTTDCRIFQNLSVPKIIEQIFAKYPVASYTLDLSESHPDRDYCVQYNESDLNFVLRLMEDEGIFYFFEHKMILTDNKEAYLQRDGYKDVPFYPREDKARRERDHLYEWRSALDVRPGRFSQTSFDFERPYADLATRRSAPLPHSRSDGEVYCYPACYVAIDHGDVLARLRLEEHQASHKRMRGAGTVAGLGSGQTFGLTNYPRKDQNEKYLVLAVEHEIWADAYRSSSSGGEEEPYLCTIEVQPSAVPFRPPLLTPKPVMPGPESAIVTGPSGEEIWTDKYGRVKVQFPWDRLGKFDENSSCWIRVSQAWAGTGFGGIHIPRIGQEVIVEFLQGDPDRPIITGRVYDGANMPPYELPAKATQSGLKSNSSKGGAGFNEFRFEDKKGSEDIYLHAQKTWTIDVQDAETETVGASITTNAGGNIARSAHGNITRTADQNIEDKAKGQIKHTSNAEMLLHSDKSYQLTTNHGIHLKAINLVGQLIESGAKQAADALKKSYMKAGAHALAAAGAGAGAGGALDAAAPHLGANGGAADQIQQALSPAILGGAAELQKSATAQGEKLGESYNKFQEANDKLAKADNPDAAAAAIMEMVDAVPMDLAKALIARDLWSILESFLPQIPSIELWAMKDIKSTALWNIEMKAALRDVSIEAKKRNVEVKADKEMKIEAANKDLNVKAGKTNIVVTAKKKIDVKAEEDNLTIEAGKKKVFIKSPDQIFLKCGDCSISMAKSGNIVINGKNINIKATGKLQAQGKPINLN